MATSDTFTINVRSQSILAEAAASFTSGWSAPLEVPALERLVYRDFTPGYQSYPDSVSIYDDTTGLPRTKRTWNWASRACWDSVEKRVVTIHSPAIESDNPYATQLSIYDENSGHFYNHANPLGYSVGHMFDNNGIDVAGRKLYKWTVPRWVSGQGYLQPQLGVIDLDLLSPTVGADATAVDRIIDRLVEQNDVTAPGMDWFPGVGVVMYHKDRFWICDVTTDTWSAATVLTQDVTNAIHNIGHYNPALDNFIFGGGALYDTPERLNYQFFRLDSDLVVTPLDNSPVVMSVANHVPDGEPAYSYLRKCCATYIPGQAKSVFFHNDGNIYQLDPLAAEGSHWSVIGVMDGDNGQNDDRWCCAIPDYNCVMVGHFGWDGTSKLRLWKP